MRLDARSPHVLREPVTQPVSRRLTPPKPHLGTQKNPSVAEPSISFHANAQNPQPQRQLKPPMTNYAQRTHTKYTTAADPAQSSQHRTRRAVTCDGIGGGREKSGLVEIWTRSVHLERVLGPRGEEHKRTVVPLPTFQLFLSQHLHKQQATRNINTKYT